MSAQNATYDIKWGKPDGTQGLACDEQGGSWPALPTCVNTSFTGYGTDDALLPLVVAPLVPPFLEHGVGLVCVPLVPFRLSLVALEELRCCPVVESWTLSSVVASGVQTAQCQRLFRTEDFLACFHWARAPG